MADSLRQYEARAIVFRNDGERLRPYDLNRGRFVDDHPEIPRFDSSADAANLISPPPHSNFWYEPVGKQRKM